MLALAYAVQWIVLPLVLTTTIGRDTVQILYWGMEWQAGYFKHPPLVAWLMELATLLLGRSDFVSYFMAAMVMLSTFACVHALARRYLDAWGAVMAAGILPAIGYYSYLTPQFNHNSLLMLFWAAALWLGYRVLVEGKFHFFPMLGLVFGLGILTKYTMLLLPGVFLLMVLSTPRLRSILLSPWAWTGVAVCFLVASPNLYWLARGNLHPLAYMLSGAGVEEGPHWTDHILAPGIGLLMIAGMAMSGLAQALITLGKPRISIRTGSDLGDSYLIWALLGPIGLISVMSLLSAGMIRNEWASPFLLVFPLAVLRFGYRDKNFAATMPRFIWTGSGLAVAMSLTYGAIMLGYAGDDEEARWNRFPAQPLADQVETVWALHCQGPVPVVIGDAWLAGTASHKMTARPRVYTEADPVRDPWLNDDTIRALGAVAIWNTDLSGRYREIDHQDPAPEGVNPDWLEGAGELEARFGPLAVVTNLELPYPGPVFQAPVKLTIAVIPPAGGCDHK